MATGHLFVISAPSGAGKTSLIKAIMEDATFLQTSVSYTTRPKRDGEVNGKDYHFVDKETFIKMRDANDFLEYAEVFGNFYGTSKSWLTETLAKGDDVILEIDWQGADQVKKSFPESTGIFIFPPSKKILLERLQGRGTDSEEVIQKRTAQAILDMSQYPKFDYLIVNDDFDIALKEIQSVIQSFRLKTQRQYDKQPQLFDDLISP